jgi:ubiquinone/menaquinone biosynthesis C-methylase UbiE
MFHDSACVTVDSRMLLRLLHLLASNGWIYDRIQIASGARRVYRKLAVRLASTPPGALVLDIGGGTGGLRSIWRAPCRYVCLDLELPKLRALRAKFPASLPLLADAGRIPLPASSADALVCTAVAHHLTPDLLEGVLQECARVLRPGGQFIFLDALHRPDRRISRFLWSLDRGAGPYGADDLRRILSRHFEIAAEEQFTIFHHYFLAVLRKPPAHTSQG